MVDRIIVLEKTMKKSEKVKGREAVAAKKRLYPKLAMVAACLLYTSDAADE